MDHLLSGMLLYFRLRSRVKKSPPSDRQGAHHKMQLFDAIIILQIDDFA